MAGFWLHPNLTDRFKISEGMMLERIQEKKREDETSTEHGLFVSIFDIPLGYVYSVSLPK